MDNGTLVSIMWAVLGAVATSFLGLLFWGVKSLVTTTFENTVQIKLLNQHIVDLLKIPVRLDKLEKDVNIAHDRIRAGFKNGEAHD